MPLPDRQPSAQAYSPRVRAMHRYGSSTASLKSGTSNVSSSSSEYGNLYVHVLACQRGQSVNSNTYLPRRAITPSAQAESADRRVEPLSTKQIIDGFETRRAYPCHQEHLAQHDHPRRLLHESPKSPPSKDLAQNPAQPWVEEAIDGPDLPPFACIFRPSRAVPPSSLLALCT